MAFRTVNQIWISSLLQNYLLGMNHAKEDNEKQL